MVGHARRPRRFLWGARSLPAVVGASRVRQLDGLVLWRAGDGALAIGNFNLLAVPTLSGEGSDHLHSDGRRGNEQYRDALASGERGSNHRDRRRRQEPRQRQSATRVYLTNSLVRSYQAARWETGRRFWHCRLIKCLTMQIGLTMSLRGENEL